MALIAIDGDGPLLDYNKQFGLVWARHFGAELTIKEKRAYHATHYWGIDAPGPDDAFWSVFDQHGWGDMPAIEGAVDACHALVNAGHELVCVTSMPTHRGPDRARNLALHGFPIARVIATGHAKDRNANPKREAIETLGPDWFIDDELRKLKDLGGVKCVLVDPGHPDSPNLNQPCHFLEMTVGSMSEFAERFLALDCRPERPGY